MKLQILMYTILVGFSSIVVADSESIPLTCSKAVDLKDNFPTSFLSLQGLSVEIGPVLCRNALLVTDEEKTKFERALTRFTTQAKHNITTVYPDGTFPGVQEITDDWIDQLFRYEDNHDFLNPIIFEYSPRLISVEGSTAELKFELAPFHEADVRFKLDTQKETKCNETSNKTCAEAMESLSNAIKPAFIPLNTALLDHNDKHLESIRADWKTFIDKARYQTPLDVWVTTQLQQDYFGQKKLVGPPQWQAFLLRPSIVFEHIHELESGNRDDVSLAVEWIGVNWWKKGFGLSLTSVYHDRKEADA
ncbi:hypothetical protein AB4455_26590 [Vibrio sp. 10N.261.46.E12]|uniref:hypothetical protein n=1 Tax=unclassified Vibrio TaxID=2614977 RepID=UPI0009766A7F|nr:MULTISPECIES: hypothetical protein [unclassified Vibrio]OMO36557.1 hypothetical protein BH584_25655 [Vibrio sp. 10N.261.45.E1]PMJ30958.1 hypothetical protein BCU27_25730 [Vibrio sp. 10N.286.45.B6]PML92284.1 hypothetical protein BCT66_25570 [Vibrio sp. 10N.261.49.E11]PMM66836.1 hypothetical protein BCT48_16520 [Vibrio sp. 10N.261.46.F12]PMM87881.1 hypothetical protein BCT46_25955 [Vibrio sp. 10N.261.46.E8]